MACLVTEINSLSSKLAFSHTSAAFCRVFILLSVTAAVAAPVVLLLLLRVTGYLIFPGSQSVPLSTVHASLPNFGGRFIGNFQNLN
jgi:hypothetical protein